MAEGKAGRTMELENSKSIYSSLGVSRNRGELFLLSLMGREQEEPYGWIRAFYRKEAASFAGWSEAVLRMEYILKREEGRPYGIAAWEQAPFRGKEQVYIHVMFQEHLTWQGEVRFHGRRRYFRSVPELLHFLK